MPPRSFERNDGGLPSLPVPPPRIEQQFGIGEPQQPLRIDAGLRSTPFGEWTEFVYGVMASPQGAQGLGEIARGMPEAVYIPREPLTAGECAGWAFFGLGVGAVGVGVLLAVKGR